MHFATTIKHLLFIVSMTLLISSNLFPQVNFEIMYGGLNDERGVIIENTNDGGYIVGGSTRSFGSGDLDIYLIKMSVTGDVEWSKTYSTFGDERVSGLKQTAEGNYYVVGWMAGGFGFLDILMMKLDTNGNMIWEKNFGGIEADEPRGVSVTDDGGILVSGYAASFGFGAKDIQLIRLDANGSVQWAKTIGGIFEDHISHNLIDSQGNFIFSGASDFTGVLNWTPTLLKTDPLGNIIWIKRYPGNVQDWSRSVIELSSGGYVFVGNTASFGVGQNDVYVVKTDTAGNVEWAKAIGGTADDIGYSVVETNDGKIAVSGYSNSFGYGGYDAFLMMLDISGDLQWTHMFGTPNNDFIFNMKLANDGGFVLTGTSFDNTIGASDVYVIKTDQAGNTNCGNFEVNPIVTDVPLNAVDVNFGSVSIISISSPSYSVNVQGTKQSIKCRVIPVELGSYNSKVINNSVSLTWETVTETNNLGFEIRRDGKKIGFVNGNGTTTEKHDYDFTDKNLVPGKYEYKVIQIDFDGTRDELFKIMVDVNNIPNEFSLSQNYPNPFNPSTKITYTIANQSHVILKVYNSLGTEVKTLVNKVQPPGFYYVNFDGASLSSGVYFYTIRAGNYVSSKKMILIR